MGRTILTVDDSVVMRAMLDDILSTAGYAVVAAADGRAALDRISADRPDLVLTDVDMPLMDGLALLEAMRDDPRLREVPTLVVSADENPGDRGRAAAAGASGWLSKPFDPGELLLAVRTALG